MNILIVDDNKNNRMILHLLLEEYMQEQNTVKFNIKEVEDGKQAVEAVKLEKFELIFMDIMMPHMDGIEATALIRRLDKSVMIIAVSAVDDSDRKKVILNNGAEDYISKPINSDIFGVRLHSYLKLLESRMSSKTVSLIKTRPHNLFENNVYTYETHFNGENEDMLSAFWEYYLLNDTPYEGLSDMIRFIYDMSLDALKHGRVDIFEENTEDMMYLTVSAQKAFDPDMIMLYADKNNFIEDYKVKAEVFSTKLKKKKVLHLIEVIQPIKKAVKTNEAKEVMKAPTVKVKEAPNQSMVFDLLDPDDFEDLKDYISKLNSLLLILGSSPIEEHEVDELVMTLLSIAKSVSAYNELYAIGSSLGTLGTAIDQHRDIFIEKSLELGPLAVAFGGDLSKWFQSLFITGAVSIDFLDDSIISNAKMIESFINPPESYESAEMDDIFDF